MARYRKKPIVIEAFQLKDPDMDSHFPKWFFDALDDQTVFYIGDGCYDIVTLEGVMRAEPGDYIIKGIKGELYPCDWCIFKETYEEA